MTVGARGTPQLPRPRMQAMLLADHAIRDAASGKATLIGVFNRIVSTEFPLHYLHSIAVYARMTDAEGDYPIRLDLLRLDDDQTIGRLEGRAIFGNRLEPQELIFESGPVVFERAGTYEFSLFADGLLVGEARLTVIQQSQPQGETP